MTKNMFEMPDMDDLARQMKKAMEEAQDAMDDIPQEMGSFGDIMGSLSSLMGNMPEQMGDLTGALSGFGEQHQQNVDSLAGDPDWSVSAEVKVGSKLHVVINAIFDLKNIRQAWESTQGEGFEDLVKGVAADADVDVEDEGMLGQIMEQLKKGRSIAKVENIKVISCNIAGAPGNAAESLQLSPEGNIPLVMNENGIGFELAPVLTIRNQWENANIPVFVPMGEELMVPLGRFEGEGSFTLNFEPDGQEERMVVSLSFAPLG